MHFPCSQLDGLKTSKLNEESEDLQYEAMKVHDDSQEVSDNVKTQYNSLKEYAEIARTLSKNNEDARRNSKLALAQSKKRFKQFKVFCRSIVINQIKSSFLFPCYY